MNSPVLLRYGSLTIYDGWRMIYMGHAGCYQVLATWPKKISHSQRIDYSGMSKMNNNKNFLRCKSCKQGIPNKAFEFLERTAMLLAK